MLIVYYLKLLRLILHRNGRIESQNLPRAGYRPRLVSPVQWLTPVQ
jgi:hypothetical protein